MSPLINVQIESRSVILEEPQISTRVLARTAAEQNELGGVAKAQAADSAIHKVRE